MPTQSQDPPERRPINWDDVRAKVKESAATGAPESPPAEVSAILARRAAALARPVASGAREAGEIEIVVFELSGQTFGLEIGHVRETILPRDVTLLPGMPDFVRGVVNVRSRVVAAIDLRPLLALDHDASPTEEKMIIVEFNGAEFGLLTHRVLGIRFLSENLRRDVPGLNSRYLRGLASDGTLLLDLPALFPDLVVEDKPDA